MLFQPALKLCIFELLQLSSDYFCVQRDENEIAMNRCVWKIQSIRKRIERTPLGDISLRRWDAENHYAIKFNDDKKEKRCLKDSNLFCEIFPRKTIPQNRHLNRQVQSSRVKIYYAYREVYLNRRIYANDKNASAKYNAVVICWCNS